jgi:hypothetical protein
LITSRFKVGLVLIALSLWLCPLVSGCAQNKDFDHYLSDITEPYRFDFVKWELHAFGEEIGKLFSRKQSVSDDGIAEVTRYFSNVARIMKLESDIAAIKAGNRQGDPAALEDELSRLQEQNAEAADIVERLLETQIREALSQQGIFHPIDKYVGIKVGFPPVNFELARPPHLLVISPRDRIESMREIALLPEMSREAMESLEAEVDKLGVSSLVVGLGGMATYPSHVTDRADLRFILNTACEEWVHQYLAFKPLGFLYVLDLLGIRRDYEIATMNETLAGMVSKEIGAIIYEKYYAPGETGDAESETAESGFDFNEEMREIRRAVDNYLAHGEIEQAEEFMEVKRQYLAENGYYIRKLNQAYFAFHGTYADKPTSISPIGVEMKQLRSQSDSLKDFLETAASMSNHQELTKSIR